MPHVIDEPLLNDADILDAVRKWCAADEAMIESIDFARMTHPRVHPMEARMILLLSWAFLLPKDRRYIFPCLCCMFIPHIHDTVTGCGPNLVYLDEWPAGEGQPTPRIEGVTYSFGNPN